MPTYFTPDDSDITRGQANIINDNQNVLDKIFGYVSKGISIFEDVLTLFGKKSGDTVFDRAGQQAGSQFFAQFLPIFLIFGVIIVIILILKK